VDQAAEPLEELLEPELPVEPADDPPADEPDPDEPDPDEPDPEEPEPEEPEPEDPESDPEEPEPDDPDSDFVPAGSFFLPASPPLSLEVCVPRLSLR
jgi:hypothetical protein